MDNSNYKENVLRYVYPLTVSQKSEKADTTVSLFHFEIYRFKQDFGVKFLIN